MAAGNPVGEKCFRVLLAPRISRNHFFLAVFVRASHDGQSERGTTRSLVRSDKGNTLVSVLQQLKMQINCSQIYVNKCLNEFFWYPVGTCDGHFQEENR